MLEKNKIDELIKEKSLSGLILYIADEYEKEHKSKISIVINDEEKNKTGKFREAKTEVELINNLLRMSDMSLIEDRQFRDLVMSILWSNNSSLLSKESERE